MCSRLTRMLYICTLVLRFHARLGGIHSLGTSDLSPLLCRCEGSPCCIFATSTYSRKLNSVYAGNPFLKVFTENLLLVSTVHTVRISRSKDCTYTRKACAFLGQCLLENKTFVQCLFASNVLSYIGYYLLSQFPLPLSFRCHRRRRRCFSRQGWGATTTQSQIIEFPLPFLPFPPTTTMYVLR